MQQEIEAAPVDPDKFSEWFNTIASSREEAMKKSGLTTIEKIERWMVKDIEFI
jgi:hypothetical protein